MKEDKVLIAGLIGVVATIPCEIVLQITIYLGLAKYSEFGQSSLLITGDRPSIIIGFFVSSVIGAFISVLLYQAFQKLGSQHLAIKCVGASILMWVAIESVFTIYFERKLIPERLISGYYCHLVGAFVFGITQGVLFRRYLFYKHIKCEAMEDTYMEIQPAEDKPKNKQILEDQNIEKQNIEDIPIYDINELLK